MQASVPLPTVYDNRPSLRTRLAALALSLAVVALLLATLIAMGMLEDLPGGSGEHLTAVTMPARNQEKQQQHEKANKSAAPNLSRAVIPVPHPMPKPPVISKAPPVKMIEMSKADFVAADISKLSRPSGASSGSGSGAGSYGPGEGPGGAQLYKAEWYREPSHAELAGYLQAGAPPGSWAMIACKTADHYHVEDCRQLGESPPGSGLSRALRLAAWQFLVRPPRIDGKPIIGVWVSIRFDFTRAPRDDGE